jgi:predicted DNA-binding transcriptional regulator AlpA
MGRLVRYRPSEVEAWMQSNHVNPEAALQEANA